VDSRASEQTPTRRSRFPSPNTYGFPRAKRSPSAIPSRTSASGGDEFGEFVENHRRVELVAGRDVGAVEEGAGREDADGEAEEHLGVLRHPAQLRGSEGLKEEERSRGAAPVRAACDVVLEGLLLLVEQGPPFAPAGRRESLEIFLHGGHSTILDGPS
jgi:hypothetical protein